MPRSCFPRSFKPLPRFQMLLPLFHSSTKYDFVPLAARRSNTDYPATSLIHEYHFQSIIPRLVSIQLSPRVMALSSIRSSSDLRSPPSPVCLQFPSFNMSSTLSPACWTEPPQAPGYLAHTSSLVFHHHLMTCVQDTHQHEWSCPLIPKIAVVWYRKQHKHDANMSCQTLMPLPDRLRPHTEHRDGQWSERLGVH